MNRQWGKTFHFVLNSGEVHHPRRKVATQDLERKLMPALQTCLSSGTNNAGRLNAVLVSRLPRVDSYKQPSAAQMKY